MNVPGRRRHAPSSRRSSPLRQSSDKNHLVASGERIDRRSAESIRRLVQPWQTRAFAYYDLLGEIKFAAQFYSRSLASLELFAAEYEETPDGRKELVATDDELAVELLDRIQDPGGGRSGLLSSYGRLMFLAGEAYLLVTEDPDTGLEQWEMLSTDELRPLGGGYSRYKAPSLPAEEFREPSDDDFEPLDADHAIAYRLWKRHPRYSYLADSTMQGVLDLCEVLVLMNQAMRGRIRSRMAGPGVLWLDDDISDKPLEPVPDENPDEDPFLADIIEAATTAIVDEGSAASVAPIIERVNVPEGKTLREMIYHLQLNDPTDLYPESGIVDRFVDRIAIGLDLPPEVLTGITDANHWSAWMVDEQVWKAHLQPICQQLVDDLTSSYYRPALRAAGHPNWQNYAIAYDAADIINHPDRGKDAMDLYGARAIGKHALREAKGFDDTDAPDEQELNEMIGIAVNDGTLATTGEVKQPAAPPDTGGAGGETEPEPSSGPSSSETDKTPPEAEPEPGADDSLVGAGRNGSRRNGRASHADQVMGGAWIALYRLRDLAGNRVKGAAKRDPQALTDIAGVKASLVPATLGRDRVVAIWTRPERDLVAGGRESIADAFDGLDVPADVAELIFDGLEEHAARTLYDERPRPLPPSFANRVRGALTAARSD